MSLFRPSVDEMKQMGVFSKVRLALAAMVALSKSIVDPWGQMAFQWALDSGGIGRVASRAAKDEQGQLLLKERPEIRLDLRALSQLPEGTFGRFVADWFSAWGIAPFAARRTPTDEVEYFVDRLFFAHDLWHAVVGLGTDLRNELRFLGVTLAQYGSGSAVMALVFGWLQVPAQYGWRAFFAMPAEVWRFYRWSRACSNLCYVRWETMLEMPLEQVRAQVLAPSRPRIGEWQTWPAPRIVLPPQRSRPVAASDLATN